MKPTNEILIRRFEHGDQEAVARILAHSFAKKFRHMVNLDKGDLAPFLRDTGFVYDQPFNGYWVAQVGGRVAGVLVLKWKGQERPKLQRLSTAALVTRYGLTSVLRLALGSVLLYESLSPDEAYIEHVAVLPQDQDMGIGRKMIEHGRARIQEMGEIKRYTLNVADSNSRAVRLYEQLEFSGKKKTHSLLTRILLGESSWLYMESRLDPGQTPPKKYRFAKDWWLGFLGIVGFVKLPSIIAAFQGGPLLGLGHALWFLCFLYFLPDENIRR